MPNLQHWLNAWVKVNSKQSSNTANNQAATNSNGHGQNARLHHSKASTSRASSTQSTTTTTHNNNPTASISARSNGIGVKDHARDGVSSINSMSALTDQIRGLSSSSPEQTFTSIRGSNGDPERTAIRRYSSRRHKRRLQKTNSFSDLIREQAKVRFGRSSSSGNRHVSKERASYSGEMKRRHSHHYHPQHPKQQQHSQPRYPPKTLPPPPTLHHFVEPPEPSIEGESSDCSSVQSISPSETAITEPRSNTQPEQRFVSSNYPTNDRHETFVDHSNSALFGVAEFFGTEIDEVRPTFASSGPRHKTHAAQHGLEDEQPSYLIAHLQNDMNTNSYDPDPPSSASSSPHQYHHSIHYNNNNNNTTSSSSTRLKHSQHHQENSRYAILHQRNESSSRVSYPPLPPYHHRRPPPKQKPTKRNGTTRSPTTAAPLAKPPSEAGYVLGGVRLPFFSRPATPQQASESNNKNQDKSSSMDGSNNNNNNKDNNNPDSNPFGVGEPNCQGCQVAKAELQCTQESLEYMRTLSIRKEYTCVKCGKSNDNNNNSTTSGERLPSVQKSSQQLSEVTARHRKQVEQLIKERNHWQRNMHQKLDKVSHLSRSLNSESSLRVAESQELKIELEQVKVERDQMAGELEQLKTTLEEYQKDREENLAMKEKLSSYENEGLRQAEEAIAARNDVIAKLSARLSTALDTLATEREQQRQRRQIIFPPKGHIATNGQAKSTGTDPAMNSTPPNHETKCNPSTNDGASSEGEELKRLREQLLESQRQLESAQLEAKQKETALLFRCETLEKQLENARGPSKKYAKETHHLSSDNGWDIR